MKINDPVEITRITSVNPGAHGIILRTFAGLFTVKLSNGSTHNYTKQCLRKVTI